MHRCILVNADVVPRNVESSEIFGSLNWDFYRMRIGIWTTSGFTTVTFLQPIGNPLVQERRDGGGRKLLAS